MRFLSAGFAGLSALAWLAVAGCDAAGPLATDPALRAAGLHLDADRTAYRNRDTVRLRLTHTGSETYWTGVLECAMIERWDGRAWTPSRDGNDRACIAIAVEVAPGDTLTAEIPFRLPDGSYRFAHSLGGPTSVTVATAAIRVE